MHFTRSILGHDRALVWPLHEQALALGARPHWLGHIQVEDAERVSEAFVERGALRLGPTRPMPDGGQVAVLRDPGGAIVALSTPAPASAPARVDVVWQVLNTNDAARATTNYCELFGWQLRDRVELERHGVFQELAWHVGGPAFGAIGDIASRPGVHPHWLYFFEVDRLEPAISAARAAGGLVLEPFVLPDGQRSCVCDDPQGAAFALRERRAST